MFLDTQQSPLLSVSRDGHEGHFAIAYQSRDEYHHQCVSFGFIAMRFVQFSDQVLLVSWCKGCPCGSSSASDDFFQDKDFSRVSSSAFFGQLPPSLCFGAEQLLESWGGSREAMQSAFLRRATGGGREQLPVSCVVPITGFNTEYSAVRTSRTFRSWGVVKSPGGQRRMCLSCVSHRRQCSHVSALPELPMEHVDPAAVWERFGTR